MVSTAHHSAAHASVNLPLARARALLRGTLWAMPAGVMGLVVYLVLTSLDFRPSAITSRWVTYSMVLALVPVALGAAALVWTAARWLLLGLWPAPLGIIADESALVLRLGPFGTRAFPAAQLELRYPYELAGEDDDGGFEAYLPEEQQHAQFLPRITHPAATVPLNRQIMRFTALTEPDAASALRPVIDVWRENSTTRRRENSPPPAAPA